MGDIMKLLNDTGKEPEEMDFTPEYLGQTILLVQKGVVNRNTGKKVLAAVFKENVDPQKYVKENGLEVVTDDGAVRKAIEEVIAANEKSVNEYKSGKEKALQYLVGQSMRALRGKANPQMVTSILLELLK